MGNFNCNSKGMQQGQKTIHSCGILFVVIMELMLSPMFVPGKFFHLEPIRDVDHRFARHRIHAVTFDDFEFLEESE